jgi:hypothetical protein
MTVLVSTQTREAWLSAYAERIQLEVFTANGLSIYNPVRLSVGWPSKGALSRKRRVIGQCWSPEVSRDGYAEIFISPVLDDVVVVGATIVHELVHAAIGTDKEHSPAFKRAMGKVGLTGKPTATEASEGLAETLRDIVSGLGEYPHGALSPQVKEKVQGTRLIKAECLGCGYTIRITRKWIDEVGLPACPACGETLVEPSEDKGESVRLARILKDVDIDLGLEDENSDPAAKPESELTPLTPEPVAVSPKAETVKVYTMSYCEGHFRGCLSGLRRTREYHGKALCDKCWPHRARMV